MLIVFKRATALFRKRQIKKIGVGNIIAVTIVIAATMLGEDRG